MGAIGREIMDQILDVTDELHAYIRDEFEPHEGVYRLNDFGEYVSEKDWLKVWGGHPTWWPKAWLLADNGQYTSDEVSAMSIAEIEAAYSDTTFYPEYAFYTDAGEDGLL